VVLLVCCVWLVSVIPLRSAMFNSPAAVPSSPAFTPVMRVPAGVDKDQNGVEDGLDREVADRLSNRTAQEFVNVTVMLKSEPTVRDADAFVSSGGYLTTSPWTYAVYGFGGRIPYDDIDVFAERCPDVLLVEKEAVCNASVAYAAEQVGARPYVWSTLGLQGDPSSSIAIVDTGIDASHPDFSPGFGDRNFSEKIVGWYDNVSGTTTPLDDNGHGSHCAGLAAGDGFFSTDSSGNATATWGADLGLISSSGTYLITGMMVNKTGTITVKVKWSSTGTSNVSVLPLYYGDKTLSTGSWSQVAYVSTPNPNTWYTLTYDVASTPSGGYDMYHPTLTLTAGTGSLYVVFTMSWPYTPPSDGFSAWTGMAPQTKLVGVKVLDYTGSGTDTGLISGINWIIANRMTYHITVASMSLGFGSEVSTVDSAVVNLVNSGVTTIVAAGNTVPLGSGANRIYTPGSVDEVITVAAMNQFDNIVSYSNQGGTSRYTGKTVKPDITAPGGSFYAVPLFSADSNYNDAEGEWPDVQANDSAPMQGTSMATPMVAGAVDVVEQAMGGYGAWSWTRSQALQPKMILLMTATETYPNLRETGTTSTSPTLDRGGKDVHEGYGRLNLDAAVDAVLKTYQVGTSVSDTLGVPPTLSNISVLGQRLAWARSVQLVSGFSYSFTLSVPAGADYDLYLYNSTGTTYGEPSIVAKSTTAATGGTEAFSVTAPYTGTYYVVVKRATETTGGGNFTLKSSGPAFVSVTLNAPSSGSSLLPSTVSFAYTPVSVGSVILNSSLWTNATGLWVQAATNATAVVSGAQNSMSYALNSFGTVLWNVEVFNSTGGAFASSNYTLIVTNDIVISASDNVYATSENAAHVMVRTSTGVLCVVYSKSLNGQYAVYVKSSADNGTTWVNETLLSTLAGMSGYMNWQPTMAVDSKSNLCVTWQGMTSVYSKQQIWFTRYNGTGWSTPVILSTYSGMTSYNQGGAVICVDSVDNLHVVWFGCATGYTSFNQVWETDYSGAWSTPTRLSTAPGMGTCNDLYPSITVDSGDNLDVIFRGNATGYAYSEVWFTQRTGTSWSAPVVVSTYSGMNGADQVSPVLAVDSENNLYAGWNGNAAGYSTNQIWIAVYDGSWKTPVRVSTYSGMDGYSQGEPSIAVDTDGRVHVLWHGRATGYTDNDKVWYCNRTNGVWSTPQCLQPSFGLNNYPNVRWSSYPSFNVPGSRLDYVFTVGTGPYNVTFSYLNLPVSHATVYLLLTEDPTAATYTAGQSVTLVVNVLSRLNQPLSSTLTLTVTGPSGYYYFDLQRINVAADAVGDYIFDWNVPNGAGTYVVEVGLIPPRLTAYDAVWLRVV
jgi:subtilisin family serine protease